MVFGHVRPGSEKNVASFSNGFVLPSRDYKSLVPDYNSVESRKVVANILRECCCIELESFHHIRCDLFVRMQKSSKLFQLHHVDLTRSISQSPVVAAHLGSTYDTSFDKTAIAWMNAVHSCEIGSAA